MLSGFTVQMRYMMCLLAQYRSSIRISILVPGKIILIKPKGVKVMTKGSVIPFENLEQLNNYLSKEL